VVVSDHAPLLFNTEAIAEGRPLRFDSVLLIDGPDADEVAGWEPFEGRLSSQVDVPATLGGLLGVHPGPCDQGLDLLAARWPETRMVAGSGGRGLDELYVWDGKLSVRLERSQERITVLSGGGKGEAGLPAIERFIELLLPVSRTLLDEDAHAPPD